MALDTMVVADKDGLPETVNKIKSGRAAATDSQAVVISTEDLAALTAVGTKLDSAIALIGATNTAIAATNAALTTIDGRVDGLEALMTTANSLQTTQNGYLDGLETAIASTNTLLTTQNGYLDGVETAIAATNTALGLANASLDDIETAVESTTPVVNDAGVKYIDVTFSTDTAAYASGDLIADAQIVAACVRLDDATGVLHSIMIIDEDDQKAAFTIYVANASSSFGTENSAPSITDANARTILGFVDVATADYKDLGGVSVAFKGNIGMAIKPATGTDDVYVAIVNGSGTPTYTASGLKGRFGFLV